MLVDPLGLIPSPDMMVGKTVHERVREALREAVSNGSLPPRLRLRQTEIAHRLGVSVTPVREALRDLAGEGLVRMDAHRGAVVESIDLKEFREIRLLLDVLWPLVARHAVVHVSDDDVREIEAIQEQIEADPSRYIELNVQFHQFISSLSRLPRTTAVLETLRSATNRVLRTAIGAAPERLHEGIHEHRAIIEALRRRDEEGLVAAVLAHQVPTWDRVELLISSEENQADLISDMA